MRSREFCAWVINARFCPTVKVILGFYNSVRKDDVEFMSEYLFECIIVIFLFNLAFQQKKTVIRNPLRFDAIVCLSFGTIKSICAQR